ncbi:MAG: hemolysin III family protein [Chloroflexi bacterium]|nr:hemolysin III family protein [Chloroflexota bacterium]
MSTSPARKFRDPVSGLTHFWAAVAAALGLILLLILGRGAWLREASLLIYGLSLVLMFASSAAYHLVHSGPRLMHWLRTLDHSAIYLLIAGTYTPICLHFFTGFWRWGMLFLIWALALIGIAVKFFILRGPRWLTAGIYLVMGWLAVSAIGEMLRVMPLGALVLLGLGALFFSLGAVIYIAKHPDFAPGVFGFHELWHVFVILGCLSHYLLIAVFVAPAAN